MAWKLNGLYFKQTFANGYRYLDKCGEFLLAVKKEGFIPGEVKPSGGQITIPELRINGAVNTTEITLRQDFPGSQLEPFQEKAVVVATYAESIFGPLDIQTNGFAGKWLFPARSAEHAAALSLQFKSELQDKISDKLGMSPAVTRIDLNFDSGKTTLHVVVQPVTSESAPTKKQVLPLRPTREQRTIIDRVNAGQHDGLSEHGLLLDVDLIEFDPPPNALQKHYSSFLTYAKVLQALLSPKE